MWRLWQKKPLPTLTNAERLRLRRKRQQSRETHLRAAGALSLVALAISTGLSIGVLIERQVGYMVIAVGVNLIFLVALLAVLHGVDEDDVL